ncbi:heterodisulfide reductase subunit B [Desulfitispora alkaliphila]|uniref:CoB--CoM heterodisulfide reductase iron-sulfur subunit B family protein n=1 Tax=Desulfitispora alkaliphila TaxID=622674 RepID=UPI003D1A7CA6
MKYSYYPGCSLHATAKDYQMSIDQCFQKLDIELEEIQDWNCCGATSAASENQKTALAIAAANLAKVDGKSREIAVSCNACYSRLNQANKKIKARKELKDEVTQIMSKAGLSFDGEYQVKHLLEILCEDFGLDAIKGNISKQLTDLKVAPYYGCQMVRPRGYDHPEMPTSMDRVIEALGAESVTFNSKAKCCGAALISTNEKLALKLIRSILDEAVQSEAHVIAVSCPLCQMNLDTFQHKVNEEFGTDYKVPVVFFTQLLGLGMSINYKNLGIDRGIVSAVDTLSKYF